MSVSPLTSELKLQLLREQFRKVPAILSEPPILKTREEVTPGIFITLHKDNIVRVAFCHDYLLPGSSQKESYKGEVYLTAIGLAKLLKVCQAHKVEDLRPHILYRVDVQAELCYPYELPFPNVRKQAIQTAVWREWLLAQEDHPLEVWREVVKNPGFEVSCYGRARLKNAPEQKCLPRLKSTGYLLPHPQSYHVVRLNYQERSVQYMVAAAFVDNASKANKILHRDGNHLNNSSDNLGWVKPLTKLGQLNKPGVKSTYCHFKLNFTKAIQIFEQLKQGADAAELAQRHNVLPSAIEAIRSGKTWAYHTGMPIPKGRRLTPADKEDIQREYEAGETKASIAKRYDVSPPAISKAIID